MIKNIMICIAVVSLLSTVSCKQKEELGTITLDENNEVIAQDQVDQMALIAKKSIKPEDYPTIEIQDKDFDFGTITQDDVVEHVCKFKNTGKVDLVVLDARASCGCTVPEWTKTPVKAGESGQIKIIFNSRGKLGNQHKTITLKTNTLNENEIINFKVNINPKPGEIGLLPSKLK